MYLLWKYQFGKSLRQASMLVGGGKWQLANISSQAPGRNTLEYVGRLPKAVTPAMLIDTIQQNGSSFIVEVVFRSLKGLKSPLVLNKQPEKVEERIEF